MNRHEQRKTAMSIIYQYLLVNADVDALIQEYFIEQDETIDPYIERIIHTTVEQKDTFSQYIDNVLVDWTYDRLGYIEQAILLNGCSEFYLKELQAVIIIDEAVELAKEFCGEDTYKLVNSVLDKI